MSKKHENIQKEEDIKKEQAQVQETNNESKQSIVDDKDTLHQEIITLKNKLQDLLIESSKKDEKILRLEKQIDEINKEFIQKVNEKIKEGNEKIKLKLLDLQNSAKEELEQKKKYAIEPHAIELVNIINQLDSAVNYQSADQKINNFLIGFKMFSTMFHQLLEQMHVKIIPIQINDEFNPNYMQCVEYIDDKDIKPGHVTKVISIGYKLHDHIIVLAKVNVAKNNEQKN